MMTLKLSHIFQATPIITAVINQNRPLSQKGAYRFARLYDKLKPEYDLIVARRNTMIEAYQHKEMVTAKDAVTGEDVQTESEFFSVPMAQMPEFNKAWEELSGEEIEVQISPVPLDQLCNPNAEVAAVSAGELIILGDLVGE